MDNSKSTTWWNKRRVALAGLIAVLATVLAVYLDVIEAIPVIVFPCLAWLAWKRFGINAVGLAFWVGGLELMTFAGVIAVRSEGNIFTMIPIVILTLAGLWCIAIAVMGMLAFAWERPAHRRRHLLGAVLAPVAAVLLMCVLSPLFQGARDLRIARYFHRNEATLQGMVDDTDAISRRLGRVPKDEDELVALRKQPMPSIPWPHWGSHTLRYYAIGEQHYILSFGGIDTEGLYVYDSVTPERGWYRCRPSLSISNDASSEEPLEETEDAEPHNPLDATDRDAGKRGHEPPAPVTEPTADGVFRKEYAQWDADK